MNLKDLVACLSVLKNYCMTIGRLSFLKLLMQESRDEKLRAAEQGFIYIDQSFTIESYLYQSFNQKPKAAQWDKRTAEEVQKIIEEDRLLSVIELIEECEEKYLNLCHFLKSKVEQDIILYPLFNILKNFKSSGYKKEIILEQVLNDLKRPSPEKPKRLFFGPSKIKIDKVFDLTTENNDIFSENADTLEDIIPSFWSVAHSEMLAAELCALTIVEYDYLPVKFYWDFAKQSWDEARHSHMYLNLGFSFFKEMESTLCIDSKLYQIIHSYNDSKKGLPIPKERNTYVAILNSDLEERIILMNILTEGPAVARLSKKMKRSVSEEYPEIRRAYEFDRVDESFHARIGNYWLKYFIPDLKERKQRIEDAKLLKGFLLATSLSENSDENFEELALRLAN